VHEAVHAAFDLRTQQPPSEIDEAVAYLGETVWFRGGGLGASSEPTIRCETPPTKYESMGAGLDAIKRLNQPLSCDHRGEPDERGNSNAGRAA
jgi:hypothetical protein